MRPNWSDYYRDPVHILGWIVGFLIGVSVGVMLTGWMLSIK